MAHKILNIVEEDEMLKIETRGDLKYMPQRIKEVRAIFGIFTRTEHSTLIYTGWNTTDAEYIDDYQQLQNSNVDIQY